MFPNVLILCLRGLNKDDLNPSFTLQDNQSWNKQIKRKHESKFAGKSRI